MKKIYKYTLVHGVNKIVLTQGYKILTAQNQNGSVVIWVLIDVMITKFETVDILVVHTGEMIYNTLAEYIASVQIENIVNHVFKTTYL